MPRRLSGDRNRTAEGLHEVRRLLVLLGLRGGLPNQRHHGQNAVLNPVNHGHIREFYLRTSRQQRR